MRLSIPIVVSFDGIIMNGMRILAQQLEKDLDFYQWAPPPTLDANGNSCQGVPMPGGVMPLESPNAYGTEGYGLWHHEEPAPSASSRSNLWTSCLLSFLRLRRLSKKMLKKEMSCMQRLRHRLRKLKKVLYVCEGMSGSVGDAMAAAARDRNTRYQSVQQDTTLGYPYQVALPDGEERHHCSTMKPLVTSDSQAEITREYIKSPPNKTPFDVEGEGPHRSCSMGVFPTHGGDWGGVQGGAHQHRYSASLDARSNPHAAVSAASSSSSSSSSWLGWGSGDESSRGSPRRARKTVGWGDRGSQIFANCIAPFTSPRNERVPHSSHDGGRRGGRHQGGMVSGALLSSHDPTVPLPYCSATDALRDISMLPVSCGPSSPSPSYPGGSGASQGVHVGSSLGVQGGLSHTFEQSSHSGCSTSADHDLPPLYSEVIENPTLYRSVSRPSEQRTNSGKI